MSTIRIGGGAGFSGDRIEPAVELVESGALDYLVFECLAERTIALAQHARLKDPRAGYDPWLRDRMEAVLPACHAQGVRIVTNMGAANPIAAGAEVLAIARRLGLHGLRVATVTGDDVLALVRERHARLVDSGRTVDDLGDAVVAANAYLGADPILEALGAGAGVVVTGRVADPSLGVAVQRHAFGWGSDEWSRLGQATVVGHLVECAGQITGGYFADPGYKDVPGLARLGFPIAIVDEADAGAVTITKVAGAGGCVTRQTVLEQLFYEVHRPDRYVTPDTVADFSDVTVTELGDDRVRVSGGRGLPRPDTLKVSVGFVDGYRGEGQISYSGPGAVSRGRLAAEIVAERLALVGVTPREARYDLIGVDAMPAAGDRGADVGGRPEPDEVRLRVVALTTSLADAERVGREVEALLTNGPAGGGGATRRAGSTLTVESTLVPRELVVPVVTVETV